MRVLIDTTVWSVALRGPQARLSPEESRIVTAVKGLFERDEAALLGIVRQELLSGMSDAARYERLRLVLRDWDDEPLTTVDHENAAACWNACAAKGIAGSTTDFLICAVAMRRRFDIFTTDPDFERYATVLPMTLQSSPIGGDLNHPT